MTMWSSSSLWFFELQRNNNNHDNRDRITTITTSVTIATIHHDSCHNCLNFVAIYILQKFTAFLLWIITRCTKHLFGYDTWHFQCKGSALLLFANWLLSPHFHMKKKIYDKNPQRNPLYKGFFIWLDLLYFYFLTYLYRTE